MTGRRSPARCGVRLLVLLIVGASVLGKSQTVAALPVTTTAAPSEPTTVSATGETTIIDQSTPTLTTTSTLTTSVVVTARDPEWRAQVTLGCGTGGSSRIVQSFDASVVPGQTALLYVTTPQSGGFALEVIAVGSDVPAPADGPVGSNLAWSIFGVPLGPWDVDTIVDGCTADRGDTLPLTGPGLMVWLAAVAIGTIGFGTVLAVSVRPWWLRTSGPWFRP